MPARRKKATGKGNLGGTKKAVVKGPGGKPTVITGMGSKADKPEFGPKPVGKFGKGGGKGKGKGYPGLKGKK